MKKLLLMLTVLLSLLSVGCSNSTNDINIMKADKAEKVVKSEYASRMKRAYEKRQTYLKDHSEKYSESEIIEESVYGWQRDFYKDLAKEVSTFRTEDEDINKLHDKFIEVSLDLYSMYDEIINLAIEEKDMLNKEKELGRELTEEEETKSEEKIDEMIERRYILEDMIDNQEEHLGNISVEIGNILGLN